MAQQTGVYVLFCKVTKKMYVGSSQELDKRIRRHFYELRNNIHHNSRLQELWNQHTRLTISIIPVDTIELARMVEQDVIDKNINSGNLLNIGAAVIGGDNLTHHPQRDEIIKQIKDSLSARLSGMNQMERKATFGRSGEQNGMYGRKHTQEARAIMSETSKGNTYTLGRVMSDQQRSQLSEMAKTRTGERNAFYGKTHSDATKAKLAEANRGKLPPNTRRVSIDGKVYESATAAGKALNVVTATILFRINSKNPQFANYFYM